jgi:N-acetylmuramoyl-L-alanine amidase
MECFGTTLALTRPATTPSVLLELGFMSSPVEFDGLQIPRNNPN